VINLDPLLEFDSDFEASKKWEQMVRLTRCMQLEDCIREIARLPDLILNSLLHGVRLELDKNQAQILNSHRTHYHWLALYLDNTIAQNPRHPELKHRKKEQPYAKLSKAVLNLASGLSEKEHWLINNYFLAPKFLWFRWEVVNCYSSLEKSNLLALLGLSPTIHQFEGKTSFRKENQATMAVYNLTQPLSDEEIDKRSGWHEVTESEMDFTIWNDPIQYISYEGYWLARNDPNFDKEYYSPLVKAWASIRNSSKGSQYQRLDDYGNIQQIQKHINDRYK
jgi:hypothetical protein